MCRLPYKRSGTRCLRALPALESRLVIATSMTFIILVEGRVETSVIIENELLSLLCLMTVVNASFNKRD